jgi:hypothetical protein
MGKVWVITWRAQVTRAVSDGGVVGTVSLCMSGLE